jgi:NDP-sugar pyrophosphorylase family protein
VAAPRHAIILTAGRGTRLQPLTSVRAKPAIPVAGHPMIRRVITYLASAGVSVVVLNLHHLPHSVTAAVGDGTDLSVSVRYSWEPVVLGTAGGPRQAQPILGSDLFLVLNGDTLTDLDLNALAADHERSRALVTLALVPNREPRRYGGVRLDERGAVAGFVPRGPAAEGSFHFIGVQIASAEAFGTLAPGVPANSIGGVYDDVIAARPGSIRGFVSDSTFWDVGTPADYFRTYEAFAARGGHDAFFGRGVRVDPSARIARSILWDDVEIGPGCRLERCIVADGVRVPAGSIHCDEVLLAAPNGALRAVPLQGVGDAARPS